MLTTSRMRTDCLHERHFVVWFLESVCRFTFHEQNGVSYRVLQKHWQLEERTDAKPHFESAVFVTSDNLHSIHICYLVTCTK